MPTKTGEQMSLSCLHCLTLITGGNFCSAKHQKEYLNLCRKMRIDYDWLLDEQNRRDEFIHELLDESKPRPPILCRHCHMDLAIRNPSGFCDHLYYPENCEICNNESKPQPREKQWK